MTPSTQRNDAPMVSIIIVNYNGILYLDRTISALTKLTYPNFEIIVTDNGSNDGSLEYLASCSNVRVVKSPRFREKNFACNYAVKHAQGDYLLMMDNDLIIQDVELLEKLIRRYASSSEAGTLGFAIQNEGESDVAVYGMYLGLFFDRPLIRVDTYEARSFDGYEIGYAPGPIIFVKKSIWREVGGYDDHLTFGGDDNDLGIQMWLRGYKNYLYAESVQLHIGMPERTDVGKWSYKFRKMVHAHFYTICKNYRVTNVVVYFPAYVAFSLFKGIKRTVMLRDTRPIVAWFGGVIDFLLDMHALFRARQRVQGLRCVSQDIFLKIAPPRYRTHD